MAVGASKPTILADKDGFFSVKNKMLVSDLFIFLVLCLKVNLLYKCDIDMLISVTRFNTEKSHNECFNA